MKVYDIINAGPRHRFLVRPKGGGAPILVSNCVQAVAADVMACGALEAERRGMPPFALIHDQALASKAKERTADEFSLAMATMPAWAKGLPVKVEAHEAKYYSK